MDQPKDKPGSSPAVALLFAKVAQSIGRKYNDPELARGGIALERRAKGAIEQGKDWLHPRPKLKLVNAASKSGKEKAPISPRFPEALSNPEAAEDQVLAELFAALAMECQSKVNPSAASPASSNAETQASPPTSAAKPLPEYVTDPEAAEDRAIARLAAFLKERDQTKEKPPTSPAIPEALSNPEAAEKDREGFSPTVAVLLGRTYQYAGRKTKQPDMTRAGIELERRGLNAIKQGKDWLHPRPNLKVVRKVVAGPCTTAAGVSRVIELPDGSGRIESWWPGKGWVEGGARLDEFIGAPPVSPELAKRLGVPDSEL